MILRRCISALLVFYCVLSITFLLVRLIPGGPFDAERKLPAAIERELLAKYRLNGSLLDQYLDYWKDLLHGDLRISTQYRHRSVSQILSQTLPVTLVLGSLAFVISLVGGILLGTLGALYAHSKIDTAILFLILVIMSLPTFVLGPLFILLFSLWLRWLPLGGWGSPSEILLPAITLALPSMVTIASLLRDSLENILQENFIQVARAKGASPQRLLYYHALRLALLPVASYSAPLAANLLTGSIVIETIFNIPGVGAFFLHAILNHDVFLVCGVVILYCGLLILFNLLIDISYRFLDPRIEKQF